MIATAELHNLAAEGQRDRASWQHLVRHDPHQRVCELLHRDDDAELWLVCWAQRQDTGFHDHGRSSGLIAVIAGAIREERLALRDAPISNVHYEGEMVAVPPGDIHRVTHAAGSPAITLHAYSPPLAQVGTYLVDDDGRLRRLATSPETVLAVEPATTPDRSGNGRQHIPERSALSAG